VRKRGRVAPGAWGAPGGFGPGRVNSRQQGRKAPQTPRGWTLTPGPSPANCAGEGGTAATAPASHPEGAPRRTVRTTTPCARPKDLASVASMPFVAPLTRGTSSAQADTAFPQPRIHSPRDCGRRLACRRAGISPHDCGRRPPRRRSAISFRDHGRRLARRRAVISPRDFGCHAARRRAVISPRDHGRRLARRRAVISPHDCGCHAARRRAVISPHDCGCHAARRRAAISLRGCVRLVAVRRAPVPRPQSAKADFAPFPRRIHSLQGPGSRRAPLPHSALRTPHCRGAAQ
jgi:hypothetical protein